MFGGHINGDSPRAIHQLSRYLPRVARFEYVMHADYARIESDGVLSVLGGNFRTRTALLNTASVLTIVGRLVLHPDETGALLAISLSDPAGRQLAQISGTAPRPVDVPAGPDGARSPELSIDADASAAYLRLQRAVGAHLAPSSTSAALSRAAASGRRADGCTSSPLAM